MYLCTAAFKCNLTLQLKCALDHLKWMTLTIKLNAALKHI